MGENVWSTALPRFVLLYAAMYAAFGVASPFLPALVSARGLPAAQLPAFRAKKRGDHRG
jgi:MFS transporter, PPP family, 3-phenylpropionic acid transporter